MDPRDEFSYSSENEEIEASFGDAMWNAEDENMAWAADKSGEIKKGEEIDTEFDDFDATHEAVQEVDFSQFKGSFKDSLHKMNRTIEKKASKKRETHQRPEYLKRKKLPLDQNFHVMKKAEIDARGKKEISKVYAPANRRVIIEGVNKFVLSKEVCDESVKNIGYHKGKKLKEFSFTFNNSNSALDFNLELFNPSMPNDYLLSTSLNINDKITVGAGDVASYTDFLYYMLANPTNIYNAKFAFAGPSYVAQINQPLVFLNKNIRGEQKVNPLQLHLKVDTMQVQSDIVFFDIKCSLNRPFIPDGMDVIQYKILAGNSCTFSFYYDQIILKKFFWKDARESKKML